MAPRTFSSLLLALGFALLVACGGTRGAPTDALEAARAAVDDAAGSERCAEAEFRAARSLLDQANAAYEARDYARARQLAEAAQAQAERAQRIAIENADDCDRVEETLTQVAQEPIEAPDLDLPDDYMLDPIYFAFNQSTLTDQARTTLERHAAWLLDRPDRRLRIEGHCDELGSSMYNIALGERRARAVRDYLQRLGVAADRMSVLSFGEERPAGRDQDLNRRAEFVVQ